MSPVASGRMARMGRLRPATFSIAVNDYGFELLAAEEVRQL